MLFRLFLCCFLIFCFTINLSAQIEPQTDSIKGNQLLDEAQEMLKTDPEKGVKLLFQIKENYSTKWPIITANASFYLGNHYLRTRQYKNGVIQLELAESIYQDMQTRNWRTEASLQRSLGVGYRRLNFPIKAEEAFLKSLDFYGKIDETDTEGAARTYNNFAILKRAKGEFEDAINYYNKALEIYRSFTPKNYNLLVSTLYNLTQTYERIPESQGKRKECLEEALSFIESGEKIRPLYAYSIFDDLGNLDSELGLFYQSLQNHEKAAPFIVGDTLREASNLHNIGLVYHKLGEFKTAQNKYQKAIQKYQSLAIIPHYERLTAENSLGTLLIESKSWDEAALHFNRILSEAREYQLIFNHVGLNIHENLVRTYGNLGERERALNVASDMLEIRDSISGPSQWRLPGHYLTIGNVHFNAGNLELAASKFEEALEMVESVRPINYELGAKLLASLGLVEKARENWKVANQYFEEALAYYKESSGLQFEARTTLLKDLSQSYWKLNDWEKALEYGHQSLHESGYSESHIPIHLNRYPAIINALSNLFNLKLHQYEQQQDRSILYEAWNYSNKLMNFLGIQLQSFNENKISESLFIQYEKDYNSAIDLAWKLFQLSDSTTYTKTALNLVEKAKYQHLLFGYSNSKWQSQLPDWAIDSLKQLSFKRKSIETYLLLQKQSGKETSGLKQYLELNEISNKFKNLKSELLKSYPNDLVLVESPKSNFLSTIWDDLSKDQSILVYYQRDSLTTYTFVINQGEIVWSKLKFDEPLNYQINQFRKGIQEFYAKELGYRQYNQFLKTYSDYGHKLYSNLVAPIEIYLNDRLVITSNKDLLKLPFEALLRNPEPTDMVAEYSFFIKEKSFFYTPSLTFWKNKASNEPIDINSEVLVFNALDNNSKHNFLNHIFPKVKYLAGSDASPKQFLEEIGKHAIIHINAHASPDSINGELSYIKTFERDSVIYASDIYGKVVNATIIMAAGCETGLGYLRSGEGIISLSHAFMFAGTDNIIHSMWMIDEQASDHLAKIFYQNIMSGKGVDKALQTAKLSALSRGEKAHPFFWAGLVASGKNMSFER